MKKDMALRMGGTFLILFGIFLSYRLYFWGNPAVHGWQCSLNALADLGLSAMCGLLIYNWQQRAGNRRWFPLAATGMVLLFTGLLYLLHRWVYVGFGMLSKDFIGFFNSICFQLLDSLAIVVSGSFAIIILQQQRDKKFLSRNLKELEYEKKLAELKYLKAQMDPHFVFNGLNMIYQQIPEEYTPARESMLQFCSILRYHMQYASNETISIEEEIAYLRSYIHFQQKRCSEFMDIEARFPVSDDTRNIEPLLLLPLVENAIKFCEGNRGKKGRLEMQLVYDRNRLEFDISNTLATESGQLERISSGLGLANVRRRLNLLYPGRHELEAVKRNHGQLYTCKLQLWGAN